MNGPKVLSVNLGSFKCIPGINLSPANKNLLTISFIFIIALSGTAFNRISFKTRYHPIMESYLILPQDLNYFVTIGSCFLINLDFLLPHIAHFSNIIILPLLVFETLGFILFVFFLHFKQ